MRLHVKLLRQVVQQFIVPLGPTRAQCIPAGLNRGVVVRRVLQVHPKYTALRGDHATRVGLQITRQQSQQRGLAFAFVTADPAHAGGPTEAEVMDGGVGKVVCVK